MNRIFLCLSEDITATAAARIAGVNRNTVNSYYNRIRELIFEESLKEAGKEFGEFECDESYFGAKRVRGKRGEKVYVKVVEDCSRESLMPIIQGLTLEGSTTCTDGWKDYDGLILNGYEHHRVSLETSLRIPPRERVRARQEPRQRNRELLELREGKARQIQRLQFRRFCATLEGVRMAVQPQARGLVAFD